MSKNAALMIVLIFLVLIVTIVFCITPAKAQFGSIQHLPQITINKDGSISPQTVYINQTGNVYTLMNDIKSTYFVKIECSNIIFDGIGHSINTTVDGLHYIDGYPASYADPSIYVRDSTNVTIQNVSAFTSNVYSIYLLDCSDCQIIGITTDKSDCISIKGNSNIITRCNGGVCVFDGANNQIFHNNITNIFLASVCQIYENNFFLYDKPELTATNSWDNGSVGNYWSNYTIRYPNAKEIDHSGIGDTAYFLERGTYSTREYPNATNTDNHPLIYPYDIDQDTISFPSVPELSCLVIIPLFIFMFSIVVIIKTRKIFLSNN